MPDSGESLFVALKSVWEDRLERFRSYFGKTPTPLEISPLPPEDTEPSDPSAPLPPGTRLDHFEIIRPIRRGGMGYLYKARNTRLKSIVALKVPLAERFHDEEARRQFHHEAQLAASIGHPNVVTIHEIGPQGEYIAMEFVNGEDLSRRKAPLPLKDILDIGKQVCDALECAHRQGVVHRDIKPSNIMIGPEGLVKVVDFGIARAFRKQVHEGFTEGSQGSTGSKSGEIRDVWGGTPAYMSPEQTLGLHIDWRSDIFSLGVVLYEAATAERPFKGADLPELLKAIREAEPPAPHVLQRQLPTDFSGIVSRCLSKQPEDRYLSAASLGEELAHLKSRSPLHDWIIRFLSPLLSGPRRRAWGMGLIVLLAACLFSVLIKAPVMDLPVEKSVMILPLLDAGDDSADKHLCQGLVRVLRSKLSRLETAVNFSVLTADDDYPEIVADVAGANRAFGANLAATCSVVCGEDRIRLLLKLIDADTLREIGSEKIEDTMANVSAFQLLPAVKLAEMLGIEMSPGNRALLAEGDTAVPRAFELYLEACGMLRRSSEPGALDQAASLFEQSRREDPGYALAFAGLAEVYRRKGDPGKALDLAKGAVDLAPGLPLVHVSLGKTLSAAGQPEEAIREFKSALERHSSNAEAITRLAWAYEDLGRFEEAQQQLQIAVYMRPRDWAAHNRLGAFLFHRSAYEVAIDRFRRASEIAPGNYISFSNIGGLYFFLERWTAARENLERSVRLQASYTALSNLGTIDFFEKRYMDAAKNFERALEIDSGDYLVWFNLATAYEIPGNMEKAQECYRRAVELAEPRLVSEPENQQLAVILGVCYSSLGNRAKARECLKKGLPRTPESPDTMVHAAVAYLKLDDRDSAIRWVVKALEGGMPAENLGRYPALNALRADPHFLELKQRAQQRQSNG